MITNLFSMENKIAIVTGGSRGLGRAIAEAFLQAGAKRVYITARNQAECLETAEHLSKLSPHGECIALAGDLSQSEDLMRIVYTLKEKENSIDVLVFDELFTQNFVFIFV